MYLYVSEDGVLMQSPWPPTQVDKDSVGADILAVIQFQGGGFETMNQDGDWSPLKISPIRSSPEGDYHSFLPENET